MFNNLCEWGKKCERRYEHRTTNNHSIAKQLAHRAGEIDETESEKWEMQMHVGNGVACRRLILTDDAKKKKRWVQVNMRFSFRLNLCVSCECFSRRTYGMALVLCHIAISVGAIQLNSA